MIPTTKHDGSFFCKQIDSRIYVIGKQLFFTFHTTRHITIKNNEIQCREIDTSRQCFHNFISSMNIIEHNKRDIFVCIAKCPERIRLGTINIARHCFPETYISIAIPLQCFFRKNTILITHTGFQIFQCHPM